MKHISIAAGTTLLLLTACSSSDRIMEPDPAPEPVPMFEACTVFTDQAADTLSIDLPANFEPNSRLSITTPPRSAIQFFDDVTGELILSNNASRLPQTIEYALLNEQQEIIETHRHDIIKAGLRIMALGDSITHGIDFFDGTEQPPVNLRVGYRLALYNALTGNGTEFDFVGQAGQRAGQDAGLPDPDNNGFPGVDIAFINDKLDDVLNEGRPDIILLHIGTNQTPSTAQGIEEIIDNANAWANSQTPSQSPIMLFVATLVPKRDAALQQVVEQFNDDLRQRIAQYDASNVVLVEQALALGDADISSEAIGIHPNDAGYAKMAETWFAAMQSADAISSCLE